ncbi:MAG: hypothetical protein U5L45_20915 [Saprospiraceae bacterium]|nr:hypothetical protein [Saprospiraceae bacterium]
MSEIKSFKQLMTIIRTAAADRLEPNTPSPFDNDALKNKASEIICRLLKRDAPIGETERLDVVFAQKKEVWRVFMQEIDYNVLPLINRKVKAVYGGCCALYILMGICFVFGMMAYFLLHPLMGMVVMFACAYFFRDGFAHLAADGIDTDNHLLIPYLNIETLCNSLVARNLRIIQPTWNDAVLEKAIKILLFENHYENWNYTSLYPSHYELITDETEISIYAPPEFM